MTARIMFYVCMLAFGASIANGYHPHDVVELLALAVPITAVLVLLVSAVVLSATWYLVWDFLEQFSDRAKVAFAVVAGLVNPDAHGKAQLPEAYALGGKRQFRLTDLYSMPTFVMLQNTIQTIGLPCRLLYNMACPGA